MTANSNTPPNGGQQPEPWNPFGQAPAPEHRPPAVQTAPQGHPGYPQGHPGYQAGYPGPPQAFLPPVAARRPSSRRIGGLGITGMVVALLGYGICLVYPISNLTFGTFAYPGIAAVSIAVIGFTVAMVRGNGRVASAFFIIPSLLFQAAVLGLAILAFIVLAGYRP